MFGNEEIRFTGIFVTRQPKDQPEKTHSPGHSGLPFSLIVLGERHCEP